MAVSGTRLASLVLALAAVACLPGYLAAQESPPPLPTPYQESVSVDRVVVDGRVVDRFANVVRGLTMQNFRLKVDGVPQPIESVEYRAEGEGGPIAGEDTEEDLAPSPSSATVTTREAPRSDRLPRLAVILFQWEIAGQKDEGFIRVMRQVSRLLDTAEPSDRFAVLGYGSSLRLLADFTADHAVVRQAVDRVRSLRSPIFRSPEGEPSLATGIGRCESTDSIEKALTCVGRALQDVAGPKTLLFCGWAAESHRASWRTDHPGIVDALSRAHASVFVLDVSSGTHRLEGGLRMLANDTGGMYNATFDFPDLARLRIRRALEGTYEIVFRSPRPGRGWHSIEVELVNAAGTAVFPLWYND